MNCCNDMTGQCDDGPGCPAHRTAEPASCPPCNHDCSEGRACAARYKLQPVVTHDTRGLTVTEWHAPQVDDGQPIAGFDHPHQWLDDLFFSAIFWVCVAASSAAAIGGVYLLSRPFWS